MIQGISPSNTDSKAAYTDTLAPGIPVVNGSTTTNLLKPTWTWNSVAGANRYRYSFSDGAPWTETIATAFNPSDNLAAGSYTLYVQAGDRAGNWSPSGSFTTIIMVSAINVKQGTTSIPNGTGCYNFGNVTLFENSAISFTIQNTGTAALNLTGAPVVQLSGVDAASFNVISEPALTIAPAGSSTFTLRFTPSRAGNQTATVSIASSDAVQNPYVFTVIGTGFVHGTLDLDTWTPGNIPAAGNTRIYSVNTTPGKTYAVTWDDSFEGSGVYTTDVKVTAYRQDLTATYFSEIDSAFHTPQAVTPQENVIYIKVAGFSTDSTGSFALKVYEVPAEPIIIVKQETTIIPNGTGSYNYGNAILYKNVTFSIRNNGGVNLNLTGTPNVQISGADASSFTVTSLPYSPIGTFGTCYFTVRFNPASPGTKTATISISNNDTDNSPYTFNVTGTGAGAIEPLILDTLITSQITAPGAEKVYSFDAVPGSVYAIGWDDSFQGSGTYTCDIKVSACRKDLSPYFSETDTGYPTPLLITAQDNVVYIKAEGFNANSTGTFALKAWLVPPKPLIKVTQGTANIGNGTGSYNYGNISLSANSSAAFTLENAGNVSLNLTGNPRVQIGGTDASCFTVTAQPSSSLAPFGKTTFTVRFAPNGPGPKNATVSIASNDTDNNPYTFAISGTGTGTITVLSPDVWNQDSIATTGEVKIYSFNATPGKTYTIAWDDSYQGSGAYTGDIKVSAYRQDLYTTYFSSINSGYSAPQNITPSENIFYVKVVGNYSSSTGSFALKVSEITPQPVMTLKQSNTNIPNGGSFNFGNAMVCSSKYVSFTIQNTGTGNLELQSTPPIQVSGADAVDFVVNSQPTSPVTSNGNATFSLRFVPKSAGAKTATVSIANNIAGSNPYVFTITGTGTIEGTLTSDSWTPGNIATAGEIKTYCLNVTPGNSYAIAWDDSTQGSGGYTGNIRVSAYRQDLSSSYFSYVDSGYATPQTFIPQENMVYIKVEGYSYSLTGSYALKASVFDPVLNLKQGTTDIPSGGNYSFGNLALCSNSNAVFTIKNTGGNLYLTDTPKVQISGADASYFSVTADPSSPVAPNGSTTFTVNFTAIEVGTKTATVSIAYNSSNSPYVFTITGTGVIEGTLTSGAWTEGNIAVGGEMKTYCFNTTPGVVYAVDWKERSESPYTCDIKVSAYRQDKTTTYFNNIDYLYPTPPVFTAQDDIVYIKVAGYSTSNTGSYALKAFVSGPVMTITGNSSTLIPSGTGSYDCGNVAVCSYKYAYFTIHNEGGTENLNLLDTPKVRITGPDASFFSLTSDPSSPVAPNDSAYFSIRFIPTGPGMKTATVCIANNDSYNNPYTFTITGTGIAEPLTLDTWTEGTIVSSNDVKTYCFNTIPGNSYAILWDDAYDGTGAYSGNVKVSAYRQDTTTSYFWSVNSGYTTPQFITAQDNMVYINVEYYNIAGRFALKITPNKPLIHVEKGGVDIPSGTGSYDFGNASVGSFNGANFSLKNMGVTNLNLTGSPKVTISGTDASSFSVTLQPGTPVERNKSATFSVRFCPVTAGSKTATVSIANNDSDNNPYTFTVTGTGTIEPLTLNTWNPGTLLVAGEERTYSFDATPGKIYTIYWDDSGQGSGTYSGNVMVTAFHQDFSTRYFYYTDAGYSIPQIITAQENIVYLKVGNSSGAGTFSLKICEVIPEPIINVTQGTTLIPSETGSFNFGNVALLSNNAVSFTLQNIGVSDLDLTGYPMIKISGADAACFSLTVEPSSYLEPFESTYFRVQFTPNGAGTKTAVISIESNDEDNSPYFFTVTGTGTVEPLTLDTWITGYTTSGTEVKTFFFNATPGKSYRITWDDVFDGSRTYNGDVSVAAYRKDLTTAYFNSGDGYTTPKLITASDDIVYVRVSAYYYAGSYALKVSEVIPSPIIGVKQGSTDIPNGTGSYNYGSITVNTSSSVTFTIQNTGNANLSLTGAPKIQISGTNASCFLVTVDATSPLVPNGNATFTVRFTPDSAGTKTALISIASDDPEKNPYTFTVTGTGVSTGTAILLNKGGWTSDSITAGQEKTYYFTATPGSSYTIAWDDSYQGSGSYSCDIKVSAYRQDLTTTYFGYTDSGYTSPRTITAQESVVYLKVAGYFSSSSGSFGLKVATGTSSTQPLISVKQGSTNISNGGSYNVGSVTSGSTKDTTFTIQNDGAANLNLTGSPKVVISGSNADCYYVKYSPSSPVAPGSSTSFTITFLPNSTGTKTATVTIYSNDPNRSTYTFTISGSGTSSGGGSPTYLSLGSWTSGTLSAGTVKFYYFNAIAGKTYRVYCDGSYQGSGSYTCDVLLSACRPNYINYYFANVHNAYSIPGTVVAEDGTVYVKVEGFTSSSSGSYAVRVVQVN